MESILMKYFIKEDIKAKYGNQTKNIRQERFILDLETEKRTINNKDLMDNS